MRNRASASAFENRDTRRNRGVDAGFRRIRPSLARTSRNPAGARMGMAESYGAGTEARVGPRDPSINRVDWKHYLEKTEP
ncbi:MAG: hypothetical protein AMXMBFR59_41570 [Rhodanobacteraceae bacterium]